MLSRLKSAIPESQSGFQIKVLLALMKVIFLLLCYSPLDYFF